MIFKTGTHFQRANEREPIRNGVFFSSEALLSCELFLLLLLNLFTEKSSNILIILLQLVDAVMWICSDILCEFRLLLTGRFVQFRFLRFFDLFSYIHDSILRLQLISSAYQRCRLSEQICRLSVGLTCSSSLDPSLKISSNPLSSHANHHFCVEFLN